MIVLLGLDIGEQESSARPFVGDPLPVPPTTPAGLAALREATRTRFDRVVARGARWLLAWAPASAWGILRVKPAARVREWEGRTWITLPTPPAIVDVTPEIPALLDALFAHVILGRWGGRALAVQEAGRWRGVGVGWTGDRLAVCPAEPVPPAALAQVDFPPAPGVEGDSPKWRTPGAGCEQSFPPRTRARGAAVDLTLSIVYDVLHPFACGSFPNLRLEAARLPGVMSGPWSRDRMGGAREFGDRRVRVSLLTFGRGLGLGSP